MLFASIRALRALQRASSPPRSHPAEVIQNCQRAHPSAILRVLPRLAVSTQYPAPSFWSARSLFRVLSAFCSQILTFLLSDPQRPPLLCVSSLSPAQADPSPAFPIRPPIFAIRPRFSTIQPISLSFYSHFSYHMSVSKTKMSPSLKISLHPLPINSDPAKLCKMNNYRNSSANSSRINTYKIAGYNLFEMNTYKKTGVGGPHSVKNPPPSRTPFVAARPDLLQISGVLKSP